LWEALGDLCHDFAEQERNRQLGDIPIAIGLADLCDPTREPAPPIAELPAEKKAALAVIGNIRREIAEVCERLLPHAKRRTGQRGITVMQRVGNAIEVNLIWKYTSIYSTPLDLTLQKCAAMFTREDILRVSGAGQQTAVAWERIRNHVRCN
jgi:hypothetical protein